MINKYKELHERFLNELVEYHNLQMELTGKRRAYNVLREISKVVMRMNAILKEMKIENLAVRNEIQRVFKIRRLEIAEEKLKKEKDNDNSNN